MNYWPKHYGALLLGLALAIACDRTAAGDWQNVSQVWYSLNGQHVVSVRHAKDDIWLAAVRRSDGSGPTWRTRCGRPLSGCVSNDGTSVCLLTGTLAGGDSRTSDELVVTVFTKDKTQFAAKAVGAVVREPSSVEGPPEGSPVLSITNLEIRGGRLVATLCADGVVMERIEVGTAGVEMIPLPRGHYVADSNRNEIVRASRLTWKLVSLANESTLDANSAIAPMSTALLLTSVLQSQSAKDRATSFRRLTRRLRVPGHDGVDTTPMLTGMKMAGCFGWSVSADAAIPQVVDRKLMLGDKPLRKSPTSYWIGQISGGERTSIQTETRLTLAASCKPTTGALDRLGRLPSFSLDKAETPDSEVSLKNKFTLAAKWSTPFEATASRTGEFTASFDDNVAPVITTYMHGNVQGDIAEIGAMRVARLPMKEGYSALLFQSADLAAFTTIDQHLFAGNIDAVLNKADWQVQTIRCQVPRVAFDHESLLSQKLTPLFGDADGVKTELCESNGLLLKNASQQTSLTINEDGISVAASTQVDFGTLSQPVPFELNRPFHVCVVATNSNFPVLLARVVSPEVIK